MTMPNFLIIGAAKTGTTSVWHYLKQHPDIYMSPKKHAKFFAFEDESPRFRGPAPPASDRPWAITRREDYSALFEGVQDERAIGEVSHSYLYSADAPARILHHIPDVKLIAILRDPVDRAYSHFLNLVRDGREPHMDFARAVEEEPARIRDHWWPDFHYVQIGRYYDQLERYFDLFDRRQLAIYLYEDWNADPLGSLRSVFRFLDVDDAFVPDIRTRYKVSGVPKNEALYSFFMKLQAARPTVEWLLPERVYGPVQRATINLKNRTLHRPPLPTEIRERLIEEHYREQVVKLQELLQRDLSSWLEPHRERDQVPRPGTHRRSSGATSTGGDL